ncbi:MAG: SusC/RagA family TonB-linked outer membrane protein [Bacteroidetes bacterium]|nr:SusC/RagA family TonB-linked outer membrane protein [Bacteroidota bacterium]
MKLIYCFLTLSVLFFPQLSTAQSVISGTVTDDTGEPLIGANVLIESLVIGASTDIEGNYSFQVPSENEGQEFELTARYVGFTDQVRTVTIESGIMTEDFVLLVDLLQLDEVVVTGVSEATPRKKLAFTVSQVDSEDLNLAPGSNPISSLQGKVAGVSVLSASGSPGARVGVRLRGSTSISESSEPLYIVDGVVLGSNQVDIDALDIANIEIVKGAAASSLYGSRAQSGVINITTQRGSTTPLNQTRVTIRNEFGISGLAKSFVSNTSHDWSVDGSGNFLDSDGAVNSCETCLPNGYGPGVAQETNPHGAAFYDNPYQGTLHNAFEEFFDPGNTWTNYVGISQNSSKTNFLASFTNVEEQGSIVGLTGLQRRSFRINLDHRIKPNLTASASGFYSLSSNDGLTGIVDGSSSFVNPFFGLMFTTPLVSLSEIDPNTGQLRIQADPLSVEENPIYTVQNTDISRTRSRLLGNFRARWSPQSWVDLEGNFSYDRLDRDQSEFYDIGFQTIDPSSVNDGRIERRNYHVEAINYDLTISLRKQFGNFATRGQVKSQIELYDWFSEGITGSNLVTVGISDLSNVKQFCGEDGCDSGSRDFGNTRQTVRSEGYYATAGMDFMDKYIVDFLVRFDGSSLFGEEERWQPYYRGSLAWRISEESFWPAGNPITELKLRASQGTAGGRPRFEAQYETLSLSNGSLSKSTLGNAFLKPELQTELELGLDIGVMDRIFIELVYADTQVEDILLAVPLAGYFGFGNQWRNAGTLSSNTIEASVNANVINSRDMSLDLGIIFDRTNQEITTFDSNPFLGGPNSLFFFRDGNIMGAMYGIEFIRDLSRLPSGVDQSLFDVNDDGYVVAVGQGNTYSSGPGPDGVLGGMDDLWGTLVEIGDDSYRWGIPIKYYDEENKTDQVEIGKGLPDFNLGFNSTFNYKGFQLYMLWGAQIGGEVYNFTRQWSYRDGRNADQDQGGKQDEDKKSTTYYEVLYDATANNNHFIEDGTYIKLREISIGYTLDRQLLSRIFGGDVLHSISASIIGRNLITLSGYSGFDPEVGAEPDPTLYRVDSFNYPALRTIRAKLEFQF